MDHWQIGEHVVDARTMKAAIRDLRNDGWHGTRDRHGNWTFTHPDGDPPRHYRRIVRGQGGHLVWADDRTTVTLPHYPKETQP